MDAAPFHADVAGHEPARAFWLQTDDAVRLRMAVWGKPERGTILIFPGRTEACEKYGLLAAEFCAAGFCVVTLDWRGQGLSQRMGRDPRMGHVGRFSDYQRDVAALLAALPKLGLTEGARYLVAHSMGGAIGLRAVQQGLDVRGVVFSAPMWGLALSKPARLAVLAITAAARRLGMGQIYTPGYSADSYLDSAPFEGNVLTHDPEMFAYLKRQVDGYPDLGLGGPSLHWLSEAMHEMAELRATPVPQMPALCLVGGAEHVVDPAAMTDVMARWSGGHLARLPGLCHEIFYEIPSGRNQAIDATLRLFAEV